MLFKTIAITAISLFVLKSLIKTVLHISHSKYFHSFRCDNLDHHEEHHHHDSHYKCCACSWNFPLWKLILLIIGYSLIFKILLFITSVNFSSVTYSSETATITLPKITHFSWIEYSIFSFSHRVLKTVIVIIFGLFVFRSLTKTINIMENSKDKSKIGKLLVVILTFGIITHLLKEITSDDSTHQSKIQK